MLVYLGACGSFPVCTPPLNLQPVIVPVSVIDMVLVSRAKHTDINTVAMLLCANCGKEAGWR